MEKQGQATQFSQNASPPKSPCHWIKLTDLFLTDWQESVRIRSLEHNHNSTELYWTKSQRFSQFTATRRWNHATLKWQCGKHGPHAALCSQRLGNVLWHRQVLQLALIPQRQRELTDWEPTKIPMLKAHNETRAEQRQRESEQGEKQLILQLYGRATARMQAMLQLEFADEFFKLLPCYTVRIADEKAYPRSGHWRRTWTLTSGQVIGQSSCCYQALDGNRAVLFRMV